MSHPATDTIELQEANAYLDALKKSFSATWHGTERTVQFLMQVLQRQSQQIKSLEGNTNMIERLVQEKSSIINTLEAKISELENHVNVKDNQLVEIKRDNDKLKLGFSHALSRCREYQEKLTELEARHQSVSAEATSFRVKLAEAEERAAVGAEAAERNGGDSLSSGLSEEQLKKMEAALKKELETRNGVVRKAAREAIVPLRNAYVASLARVKELEEQLQKHQSSESGIKHTSGVSSDVNNEGPSSSTSSHIVSGKYRPKPSPAPLGQNDSAAADSHPATLSPPSHSAQINPLPSTIAEEVIDLTDDFPDTTEDVHPTIEGAAQSLKRKRVDSDGASPGTNIIQSEANRSTQGGLT